MKFIKNWNNKLHCIYFTTIRRYSKEKYVFYNSNLGKSDKIYINDSIYKSATLIDIVTIKLKDVDRILKILDTGTLRYEDEFNKFGIGDNDDVLILLYKTD